MSTQTTAKMAIGETLAQSPKPEGFSGTPPECETFTGGRIEYHAPPPAAPRLHGDLAGLIRKWRVLALRKFASAEREKNPMGKRLIEHGAMCYYNTAAELSALLPSPPLAAMEEPHPEQWMDFEGYGIWSPKSGVLPNILTCAPWWSVDMHTRTMPDVHRNEAWDRCLAEGFRVVKVQVKVLQFQEPIPLSELAPRLTGSDGIPNESAPADCQSPATPAGASPS